jgi:hypothetical protein
MVRAEGLEPPRPFGHKILSLARLPVPPRPHGGVTHGMVSFCAVGFAESISSAVTFLRLDCADSSFFGRVDQVTLARNIVSVENVPRLMAADLHAYRLGDAGANHVPHSTPAEIVKQHPSAARGRHYQVPRSGKIRDRYLLAGKFFASESATVGSGAYSSRGTLGEHGELDKLVDTPWKKILLISKIDAECDRTEGPRTPLSK